MLSKSRRKNRTRCGRPQRARHVARALAAALMCLSLSGPALAEGPESEVNHEGDFRTSGNVKADSNIVAKGNIEAKANIVARGNLVVHGELQAHGGIAVDDLTVDTLAVTGQTTTNGLTNAGAFTNTGNFVVNGGTATFNGEAIFNSGLAVGGPNRTVSFGGNRLRGVATPIALDDAATKGYVDDEIAQINRRFGEFDERIEANAQAIAALTPSNVPASDSPASPADTITANGIDNTGKTTTATLEVTEQSKTNGIEIPARSKRPRWKLPGNPNRTVSTIPARSKRPRWKLPGNPKRTVSTILATSKRQRSQPQARPKWVERSQSRKVLMSPARRQRTA